MPEDFWEDYETFADNVKSSGHRFFANNIQRWLSLLDGEPLTAPLLKHLEESMDFHQWYRDSEKTVGSMVGSGTIDWPLKKEQRLGSQLYLMRAFASQAIEPYDFASNFLYSENNFDSMVRDINQQIFGPLCGELRQYVTNQLRLRSTAVPDTAPASDRVVPLNHNSAEAKNAINAVLQVEESLAALNDYDDPDDKSQRISELRAGRMLLSAPQVSLHAVRIVLVRCLKYLGEKLADKAIEIVITAAIAGLAAWIGITVLL